MSPPAESPDLTLRYHHHAEGIVDVHLPREGSDHRLVVLVHGGFWKQVWDRTHLRPLARRLAGNGFVVATPEYRRVGGGGGWPRTCADLRRAVLLLPALLADAGVRSTSTVLAGHSAGGHLVLWLANEDLPVDHFVALAPVADLRRGHALGLGDGAVEAFMGGTPEQVDFPRADPMDRLAERPAGVVRILHGRHDEEVPVELSRGLRDRHPWVELRELDCGHFELIDPAAPEYAEVLAALS